jgi:hypothetical protein
MARPNRIPIVMIGKNEMIAIFSGRLTAWENQPLLKTRVAAPKEEPTLSR